MSDKYTPKYESASGVRSVVENMQQAERIRAGNRALVNNLFNGGRPWSADQEKKLQVQFNTNWGEGGTILQRAITQINGALLHKGFFFTTKCLKGKVEKRDEWSQAFCDNIHLPLKRGKTGKKYMYLMRNRNAALTLHGIGPLMWPNRYDPIPEFVPLENLLIPTDTDLSLCNLTHFSVSKNPTPYELFEMTHGPETLKGWNMKAVRAVLAAYREINVNPFNYDWFNQPEKMAELWKQNRVPCDLDSVPVVRLIFFYYRSTESTKYNEKWNLKIILREMPSTPTTDAINIDEFLFEQENVADDIDKLLHVQFGDSSLVAPLKYQSVRGIGTALYSVIETMNRLRCQFAQHVFEQFLMYFRVSNPAMQDRPKQLQMFPFGIIPDGLNIVPHNERHRIDPGLVDRLFSENRQLMSENSSSFVQDIDKGQQGNPITATEANIRLQGVNAMVSSMLNLLYTTENFCYEEIVRRFLSKSSDDRDVEDFQRRCRESGIPEALMVPENWQIDAERVFGGGDQMLAEQEVTKLLQLSPQLDPTAQRMIKKQYVTVITRDPAKGELYVPDDPDKVTDGRRKAEIMFGALMADGLPRSIPEGIEREDYIATLLQMAEAKMMGIQQADNVGSPQELSGLQAVIQHIGENIDVMSQDQSKNELVKMFSDQLGQLENILKGFAQRLEQQMAEEQEAGQIDPEAQAKAQMTVQQAVQKAKINMANAQQKISQNQRKFEQQMSQEMAKFKMDQMNSFLETKTRMLNDRALTMANIDNQRKVAAASAATASLTATNGED